MSENILNTETLHMYEDYTTINYAQGDRDIWWGRGGGEVCPMVFVIKHDKE